MFKLILVASALAIVIAVNNFTEIINKPKKEILTEVKEERVFKPQVNLTSHRLKHYDKTTGYVCYLMFNDNGMYCVF